MAKTASLTAGLVAKKGLAAPATSAVSPIISPVAAEAVSADDIGQDEDKSDRYYKALTVKLDRSRYEALKNAGVKFDKKSQEIFVEALDLWLKRSADKPN